MLRQAWMVAIAGRYAGRREPCAAVIKAIECAVASGCWPGDGEHSGAVAAAVLADLGGERTKRASAQRSLAA